MISTEIGFRHTTPFFASLLLTVAFFPWAANAQDTIRVRPDYTECAPFGPNGPDPEMIPPISRPPSLLNMEEALAMVDEVTARLAREGHYGTTFVWFLVDTESTLRDVRVAQTSGSDEVDQAALGLARKLRFKAARLNGKAVCVWVARPFRFERTPR